MMRDVVLIVATVLGIVAATVAVALAWLRLRPRWSRIVGIFGSGLVVPAALLIVASVLSGIGGPGDGGALAAVGLTIYAIVAIPFTLLTAWIFLRRRRARPTPTRRG